MTTKGENVSTGQGTVKKNVFLQCKGTGYKTTKPGSQSPGEGIKVGVWHQVHDAEHSVLETLDNLCGALLEVVPIRGEEQLVGLQDELRDEKWWQLVRLFLLLPTTLYIIIISLQSIASPPICTS